MTYRAATLRANRQGNSTLAVGRWLVVEVLGPSDFGQALLAWALHERNERLRARLPAEAASLSPEAADLNAVVALLQVRRNVIAGIVAAGVR